mmetsp:Transcript_23442/g.41467  ORF Transcript_23442/g.41467 Transcript_23442/m.41467 type:complete len:131 (+) Transcript_23442:148-540(+)
MGACSTKEPIVLIRAGYRSRMINGDCVDAIVEAAEKKNKKLRVGGALWYDSMTDAVHQILEGEKKTVTALLDIIIADPRHKAVVVEEMVVVKARKFQKWGGMKITETPLLKDCLSHNKLVKKLFQFYNIF